MNQGRIKVVNGKRTGRTSNKFAENLEFLVKWLVNFRTHPNTQTEWSKVDLSKEYWNRVFEPALRMWEYGATPNPDVWCNK